MQPSFIVFCAVFIFLGLLWYAIKFTYLFGIFIFDGLFPFSDFEEEVIEDERS